VLDEGLLAVGDVGVVLDVRRVRILLDGFPRPALTSSESVMSGAFRAYARTSLMSARRFSSGSRKNAIQSSWSGSLAIR
jgi:hypothetical protein